MARGGTNNVLMILKEVTRVTRILRLMRLVKLFQQYLVRRAPVQCLWPPCMLPVTQRAHYYEGH